VQAAGVDPLESGGISCVEIVGNTLLQLEYYDSGVQVLRVLDITDITAPIDITVVSLPSPYGCNGVTIDNGFMYLFGGSNGIGHIDISDLENPKVLTNFNPRSNTSIWDVDVDNGLGVAITDTELLFFTPGRYLGLLVALPKFSNYVSDVYIYDDTVIADGSIYDASNPLQPALLGNVTAMGPVVADLGENILLTQGSDNLRWFDMSVPRLPVVLGESTVGCFIRDVDVLNGMAAVLCYTGSQYRLKFFDVSTLGTAMLLHNDSDSYYTGNHSRVTLGSEAAAVPGAIIDPNLSVPEGPIFTLPN